MSLAQRSRRGCWTCRLRRKKCDETGPPCSTCEGRGIFCHGYGPRPDWKDRGDKEKDEAMRLRLQSRSSSTGNTGSGNGSDNGTGRVELSTNVVSPGLGPGTASALGSALPFIFNNELAVLEESPLIVPSAICSSPTLDFDLLEPFPLAASLSVVSPPDQWQIPSNSQLLDGPHRYDHGSSSDLLSISVDSGFGYSFPGAVPYSQPCEADISWAMHFLSETFPLQHRSYSFLPSKEKSWLLFLLMRSSTFYYASLSTSAYHFACSCTKGSVEFDGAKMDFEQHRTRALSRYMILLQEKQHQSPGATIAILGEIGICSIHIARLEVRRMTAFSVHPVTSL